MVRFVVDWIENIVGKGENAGYQHFLLFSLCFQTASSSGSWNTGFFCKELILSTIYIHFNKLKEKNLRKILWKNVKLLKMSNFTFFHKIFYAISILKSFDSHISVVVCSFYEFGMVSKWCITEWVKQSLTLYQLQTQAASIPFQCFSGRKF